SMAKDIKLTKALKKVTPKKKMYFGFIVEGTLGHLIVEENRKLRDAALEKAKKDGKKGTQVKGICRGTLKEMEFLLDKEVIKGDKLSDKIENVHKKPAVAVIVKSCRLASAKELKELYEEEKAAKAAKVAEGEAEVAEDEAEGAGDEAAEGAEDEVTEGAEDEAAEGAEDAAPPPPPPAPPPPVSGAAAGIQKLLQKLGYDNGNYVAAVKQFQQDNGLKVDGLVGPKTQAALAKAMKGGAAAAGGDAAQVSPNLSIWQAARDLAM